MSRHDDRSWRDRIAFAYVDAADSGDLEALAALWKQAETDRELEALLRELDRGLDDEDGLPDPAIEAAAVVLDLARRHLPSGFLDPEDGGPPRASDVAAALRADAELWRKLDDEGRRANERLIVGMIPLPDRLGASRLARWGEGLGVSAGLPYWDAFHKVAVRLRMASSRPEGHRAAARPIDPTARGEEGRHDPGR